MHRFKDFAECRKFILGWINAVHVKMEYLKNVPKGFQEYYEESMPLVVLELENCKNGNMLCGEDMYSILDELIFDYLFGEEQIYEYNIDPDIVQIVEINSKEDVLKFIESEFFSDHKESNQTV